MSMRICMLQPVAMQPCCNPTQNKNNNKKNMQKLPVECCNWWYLRTNISAFKYATCFGTASAASCFSQNYGAACFKVLFLQTMDILNTHTKTHTQHCAEQNTYRWVPQCAPQLSYDCLWALSSPGKGTCFPLALGTLHMEDHCTSLSVCYATEAIYMSTQQVTHTCEPVWPRGKALGW